jgi:hypothetical protein
MAKLIRVTRILSQISLRLEYLTLMMKVFIIRMRLNKIIMEKRKAFMITVK